MELRVFWSQLAEDKLQDIFDYYKIKAGLKLLEKYSLNRWKNR